MTRTRASHCGNALLVAIVASVAALSACSSAPSYDVVIRGGTVYDGSGKAPVVADVAIVGDSIVAIANALSGRGTLEVNAKGLAVAPGFINMLSWPIDSPSPMTSSVTP